MLLLMYPRYLFTFVTVLFIFKLQANYCFIITKYVAYPTCSKTCLFIVQNLSFGFVPYVDSRDFVSIKNINPPPFIKKT